KVSAVRAVVGRSMSSQGGALMGGSAAAVERAMTYQQVIMRALAGTWTWLKAADVLGVHPPSLRRWRAPSHQHALLALFDSRPSPPAVPPRGVPARPAAPPPPPRGFHRAPFPPPGPPRSWREALLHVREAGPPGGRPRAPGPRPRAPPPAPRAPALLR